jgi:hypothetical protein
MGPRAWSIGLPGGKGEKGKRQSYDFNNLHDFNGLNGLSDTLKDSSLTPSSGQFVKKSACV